MEQQKQRFLVKMILIIALIALAWLIGFLTGLKQSLTIDKSEGQKSTQNLNLQNQLPEIPAVPSNHKPTANNLLPQIPTTK